MIEGIDLAAFDERGHISQREAQDLHTCLMNQSGITDGDAVIAAWNLKSPESPWGQDGLSLYVHELTGIVVAFMVSKLGKPL